jgi:predicted transcriptional regulator
MSGNRLFSRRSKKKTDRYIRSGKTAKHMERHLKGIANHRRIDILFEIANNEGVNVDAISRRLQCNFKTISEHLRRLTLAGLVEKKYKGRLVTHKLSPYGKIFINFLITFSHS